MSRWLNIGAVAVFLTASLFAGHASGEIYRYVDAEGGHHAVSDLTMVPPEHRNAALADVERRRGGGSVNIVDTEGLPAPETQRSASVAPSSAAQSEDWWRSSSFEFRRAVREAQSELAAAQNAAEDDITSDTLHPLRGARRNRHPGRRGPHYFFEGENDDPPSIEELGRKLANTNRKLANFNERARKAGIPPGWLR